MVSVAGEAKDLHILLADSLPAQHLPDHVLSEQVALALVVAHRETPSGDKPANGHSPCDWIFCDGTSQPVRARPGERHVGKQESRLRALGSIPERAALAHPHPLPLN